MKVAIVHYWLINMRGGEKVLEALLEIYPEADIYTHVYNPKSISPAINSHKVFTSHINKLPFAKKLYQLYLPLMPAALIEFNLQQYDLIISSEAGPAKGVVPNPDAYHICFCHSPMRYVWDMYHEYKRNINFLAAFFMRCIVPSLRIWDICSANLVDRFITNSDFVRKRIQRLYKRDAKVVYVPVLIEKYFVMERHPKDYYLVFGQVTQYKRVDIAIEACINSGRKLIVAGKGVRKKDIKKYEKTGLMRFLKNVTDDEALDLFSGAIALLYPGIEDLGLVPIEAAAAGCPVIAFRKGGATETVKENITGIFFDEQTPASLEKAIALFETMLNEGAFKDRSLFSEHVKQFSKEAFMERIKLVIADRLRV